MINSNFKFLAAMVGSWAALVAVAGCSGERSMEGWQQNSMSFGAMPVAQYQRMPGSISTVAVRNWPGADALGAGLEAQAMAAELRHLAFYNQYHATTGASGSGASGSSGWQHDSLEDGNDLSLQNGHMPGIDYLVCGGRTIAR